MSRKKKKTVPRSTRQLMGVIRICEHCIETNVGDLSFFQIKPSNLSVMPAERITAQIQGLLRVLRSHAETELLAMDAKELFESNVTYYEARLQEETVPAIAELLAKDCEHLDEIRALMASCRVFYLVVRLRGNQRDDPMPILNHMAQIIRDNGFEAHLSNREEIKRILAVYYEQNATSEFFSNYDGEQYDGPKKQWVFRKKDPELVDTKDFLTMVAPSIIRFYPDYYICGNTYRCVWALREYPTTTAEQALLRHLGDKNGVMLHIYSRPVSVVEEGHIIKNAENKNKMNSNKANSLRDAVTAQRNLQDVVTMLDDMARTGETLLHCAVYLELSAMSREGLRQLQTQVLTELMRMKLNVDKLLLRQREGFLCAQPTGSNVLGTQFERVLPATSVANLYPNNYSGKLDRKGFYIGRDKFGSNVCVDFDLRGEDKPSSSILILGTSGIGKSYLMKLLIENLLEAEQSVISLDVEHEQKDLCDSLGGCFADLMTGEYRINVLEPKYWAADGEPADTDAPEPFRMNTRLAQHISFLKDFFRTYKDFSDAQIDTIEIMLTKLYEKFSINADTDLTALASEQFPILSDLYEFIEQEYLTYDDNGHMLYTKQLLQEVLLGLHSLCKGSDAHFFNGHTNITSHRFLVFGVGGLPDMAKNVRNAILFNVLSFLSDKLLVEGNTVAAFDELYLWLSNPVAIEYIRNCMKRVRKRDSAMLLASQNLEDFDREGVRELTKPLFSIPPYQFLFNPGSIDKRGYMDMLQLEDSEYELIRYAQRGECLFKCGNERYLLQVHAPAHKEKLFGKAGGR